MTESKNTSWRAFFNGCIKASMFAAFYIAGALTSNQLSQFTITTQQDRIDSLERETALQRLQINELNRRAIANSESLRMLEDIKVELETLKSDVSSLKGMHK